MRPANRLGEIILYFCKFYPKELTRTILVKLVYLTDVEFYKKYLRTVTGLTYEFSEHGPFTWDIIEEAEGLRQEDLVNIEKTVNSYGEPKYVYSFVKPEYNFQALDEYTKDVLHCILESFSTHSLPDLLDYVYTTPPLTLFQKGEKIIFSRWIDNNALHTHSKIRVKAMLAEKITSLKNKLAGEDVGVEYSPEDIAELEQNSKLLSGTISRVIEEE